MSFSSFHYLINKIVNHRHMSVDYTLFFTLLRIIKNRNKEKVINLALVLVLVVLL